MIDEKELRKTVRAVFEEMNIPLEDYMFDDPTEALYKKDWTDIEPVKAISRQKYMEMDYFNPRFDTKFNTIEKGSD